MDRKPYYGSENRSSRPAAPSRSGSASRSSVRGSAYADRRGDSRRPANYPRTENQRRRPPEYSRPYYDSEYSSARRAPAPRRRRKKDPLARIIPLAIVACILVGGIYVGSAWLTAAMNRSTYCDEVYINGISVSDYAKAEGSQYVQDQIAARLSTTYTLTWEDQSWSFSAADFDASINTEPLMERAWNFGHVGNFFDRTQSIRSLKENPIYLEAPLEYSESKIDALVDTIYNAVYIAPVDAGVVVTIDQPFITSESSRGQELDKETAKAQIISLIENGEGFTVLPMITLEPALSTEEAISTMDLIVDYKTDTSARGWNSRYNVRKALSAFNGITVQPGDQIDFNELVGPRNEARGWQKATEYVAGTTQEDFGGGVCQASTTLYGAVLKAGMTIIERHPHSMTVAYVEPSLDAAVTNTSSKNLIFRNDTDYAIRIFTEVTKEYACVKIYGKKPEYRYELYSNIVSQDTTAVKVSYIDDTEARYCYFESDPPVLYKKGRAACSSDGYLIAYDWETGMEVTSTWLSHDEYESGTDIYWRGIHSPDEMDVSLDVTSDLQMELDSALTTTTTNMTTTGSDWL